MHWRHPRVQCADTRSLPPVTGHSFGQHSHALPLGQPGVSHAASVPKGPGPCLPGVSTSPRETGRRGRRSFRCSSGRRSSSPAPRRTDLPRVSSHVAVVAPNALSAEARVHGVRLRTLAGLISPSAYLRGVGCPACCSRPGKRQQIFKNRWRC